MIRRILVPLDGSRIAERSLPHALRLARAFSAEMRLVRVLEARHRSSVDSFSWDLGRAEAAARLEEAAARLPADARVETTVCDGDSATLVMELAARREIDLVVLTSHGAGGPSPFPLCGTAHKIVSQVPTSLLLVPVVPTDPSGAEPASDYRRVVVALDCSQRADSAVQFAARIARSAGAELVLAHVVRIPELPSSGPLSPVDVALRDQVVERNRRVAERHLLATYGRIAAPDLRVRTRVAVASAPAPALRDLCASEGADLLVLAAHGCGESTDRPSGGMVQELCLVARTPLLVFQDVPLSARRDVPDLGERAPERMMSTARGT